MEYRDIYNSCMNKKAFGSILALSLIAFSATAGDAALGAQKAAVCSACHGMTGASINPEWPNLAGQGEPYIVAQIQAFKAGKRVNPLMTPMAAALTDARHAGPRRPIFRSRRRPASRLNRRTGRKAKSSIGAATRAAESRPASPATDRRAAGTGRRSTPHFVPSTRSTPTTSSRHSRTARARRPETTSCRPSPTA